MSSHYVDNKKLYEEFLKYEDQKDEWKASGREGYPPLPDSIARAVLLIANRYAMRKTFAVLPYVDDMVSEACLVCVKYLNRFNPKLYNNPFSYITMVVQRAFIQYINKEQRQIEIKKDFVKEKTLEAAFAGFDENNGNAVSQQYLEFLQKQNEDEEFMLQKLEARTQEEPHHE